jgi:sugar lactone lactonase YvrE
MRLIRASIVFLFLCTTIPAQTQQYVISTFAGGAPPPTPVLGVNMGLGSLRSIAADGLGNTYFVESHCVFKLDQNGVVTRIAGNARAGYSGDGGPATSAQLQLENATPPPLPYGYQEPPPTPPGLAVDTSGNVYVADNGNYRIRKISPDGIINTVAGSGTPGFSGDGGPATSARLSSVPGLAVDNAGNLWIADSAHRVRQVTPAGTITTVAGTGACGFSGDGSRAGAAQLCSPEGIAADSAGNVFIADSGNGRVRRISPDGTIATVAGTGAPYYTALGYCSTLCQPGAVAVDPAGNVFVADYFNPEWADDGAWLVKEISSGMIATVAGNCAVASGGEISTLCSNPPAPGASATMTLLGGPLGLAVDNAGNLLIADDPGPQVYRDPDIPHIFKVPSDGTISVVVGNSQFPFSGDGGPATSAQLAGPSGVAVDSAGNVFIADNNRIREVTPDGVINTAAGNGNPTAWTPSPIGASSGDVGPAISAQVSPIRIAADGEGNLFFFDGPNRTARKISRDGVINTLIKVGGNDYFVALDRAGDLFIADPTNTFNGVAEASPDGTIRSVAGGPSPGCEPSPCSTPSQPVVVLGDGRPATSARLVGPQGVAVDAAGNIFIADTGDYRIRKITPDGIITTVAGNSPPPSYPSDVQGGFSGDGGPAVNAQLNYPIDVAVDGAGSLYIADYENHRIRKVSPDGIITTIAGDGTAGYSGDGGPAISASIGAPTALAVDGAGNIYVADQSNNAIRILTPDLNPVSSAGLNQPSIRR